MTVLMHCKCSICENDMYLYYKSFTCILYICNDCYHFNGDILVNEPKKNIFKDLYKLKLYITNKHFYNSFYNINSYILLHPLDITKIQQNLQNEKIYLMCDSYDNIQYAKKGSYDFFSTNSAKYFASKYNLTLLNIFVLMDTNKTIYEYTSMYSTMVYADEVKLQNISNILYHEIARGLYII